MFQQKRLWLSGRRRFVFCAMLQPSAKDRIPKTAVCDPAGREWFCACIFDCGGSTPLFAGAA
jgi:hypothetical protein